MNKGTPFTLVYDSFLSKITSDMYMELDEIQTFRLLEELLVNALHWFEFPRQNINDYELFLVTGNDFYCGVDSGMLDVPVYFYESGKFNNELTDEEINIISTYMIVEWLSQQLATVEMVRMKYSSNEFKFTSQANHMQKIMALKKDYERIGFHLQRLYKRRKKDKNGIYRSTMNEIMDLPPWY